MVNILNKQNSILNKFLAEMRDKNVQRDSMRFRRNMERVGEIIAVEISKTLNYKTRMVETPLGIAAVESIDDKIVIAPKAPTGTGATPRAYGIYREPEFRGTLNALQRTRAIEAHTRQCSRSPKPAITGKSFTSNLRIASVPKSS